MTAAGVYVINYVSNFQINYKFLSFKDFLALFQVSGANGMVQENV